METNAIFRKNYGSFRRFFSMLGKADLPYLWIIGYLAASAVIANVGVSTTEYSAALFAGNVGLTAVVLPYLFYQILSLVWVLFPDSLITSARPAWTGICAGWSGARR